MRPAHQRRTTAGAILAIAVLAAGITALTAEPHPLDAAEPGPTADPPKAQAVTPPASADCSRGDNLGFDTPTVTTTSGEPKSESEVGWDTNRPTGEITLVPNSHFASLDGTQYALFFSAVLSQSFPTLQGDVIAWTVHHMVHEKGGLFSIRFGAAGSLETVREISPQAAWKWKRHHGFYAVAHAGDDTALSQTVLSLEAAIKGNSHVNAVKLSVWCSVSVAARVVGFTDDDDSGTVTAGDVIRFAYDVRNTAVKVEDSENPEKGNRGAASLTNVAVTHDLTGITIDCPEARKKLLKPADPNSADDEMTCGPVVHTLTREDVSRGTVTATVKADDAVKAKARKTNASATPTVQARATVGFKPSFTVADKGTAVDKTVAGPAGRVDEDDEVAYSFRVENTGNVSLRSVTVPDATRVDCSPAVTSSAPLGPNASTKCTAAFSLTQPQIDSGKWSTNVRITASTSIGVPASRSHTATTTLTSAPAVGFDKAKTAPAGKVAAGDKVTYSFAVTNMGNVTLSGVSVSDPKAGEVACPETSLAPGKETTCTATYAATSADIAAGVISNRATVTAKAQDGKTETATDSESFDPGTGQVTVDRIAGPDRYATAVEISKATFAPGVDAVYVATGVNFPDALAGSAASGGDGPILLVTKDAIPSATLAELKRLKPKKIIVLGGTGVVSQAVESALRKEATTTRQSGSDRYSTAAAISAKHFDAGAAVAFVATGEDFPDALTGGPAAAKLGGPILLTQKTKLPSATISELKRLKPKRIVVVGGTGVVSEAVEKALASYTTGEVSRLAGADRYSTGGEISENAFKPGVPVAYVATGLNFPDALAGGAAGAFKDGPVLLVAGATIPKATAAELTRLKPRSIIVLGGMAVVPKTVETALGAYIR